MREVDVLSHAELFATLLARVDAEGVTLETSLLAAYDTVLQEIASAHCC